MMSSTHLINKIILLQILRFGIVGVAATVTHFLMVIALVSHMHMHPLIANVLAFLTAFIVSFSGHQFWTFAGHERKTSSAMRRFFAVALVGFGLNEFLYFILLQLLHLNYIIALAIVLVMVPPLTYVLSKFWAFK